MRRVGTVGVTAMFVLLALAPVAAGARSARLGSAPSAQRLTIVLPLVADTAGLQRFATAVSTRGSPEYGQYARMSELSRWFGASSRARARVTSFLRRSGATGVRIDPTGLFADATMTVARAERAFAAELAQFRNADGVRFVAPIGAHAASGTAYIPTALSGVVQGVVGLDTQPIATSGYARARAKRSQIASGSPIASAATAGVPSSTGHSGTSAGCAAGQSAGAAQGGPDAFTPNQYLTAYDFDPLHALGITGQGETVALIEIDGFRATDVQAFARCFGLAVPTIQGYGVGSISHPLAPGGEATLDLEVLDAAAPGLKQIDVFEANSDAGSTLEAMTAPLELSGPKQPQVISASLGLCEPALYSALGAAGFNDAEAALAAASATGVTYLSSSGDDGSADCVGQNGNPDHQLAVNYPSSSWWVTGVGGTNFTLNAANQITSQVVWNDNSVQPGSAGGGGPSARFARPTYQNGATTTKARIVPDVSMLADILPGYSIFCTAGPPDCDPSNPWMSVGGTSAATPLLAGGMALIDEELRAHDRADLGLANPLIYQLGESSARTTAFDDVTIGDNDVFLPGGETGGALGCCAAGPGFDEASGWGSVNVASFEQAALAGQPPILHVKLSVTGRQSATKQRAIKATVNCSSACLFGAYAIVKIGSGAAIEFNSKVLTRKKPGSEKLTIQLSAKELRRLKAGSKAHKKLTATVYGVLFNPTVYGVFKDPSEAIQAETSGKTVKLS
jgi:subtilase family serine protease